MRRGISWQNGGRFRIVQPSAARQGNREVSPRFAAESWFVQFVSCPRNSNSYPVPVIPGTLLPVGGGDKG
jgi:hypothetical protein